MTKEEVQNNVPQQGHPKGLYMLFMVEMWERFNYYGMRALLVYFMTSAVIGFSDPQAYKIYGWFTALVYLTPVIGGWIADNYIGKRRSITIGAILMALGQFTLASYGFMPARTALFAGLALIIIGNGFFKPNISSIVGELYQPNDPRRDAGFTIFYMGINVGAFIAPFVTGYVGEVTTTSPAWVDWRWGFVAAGVGMVIGLIWYLAQQNRFLGEIGLYPVSQHKTAKAAEEDKPLTAEDKDKIKAVFTFTFIAIFFFAFFEQAGSSLSKFAQTSVALPTFNLFGWSLEIKASWFQSINPIAVVILAPLFAKMWIKLGTKGKEPSIPIKFALGVFLTGFGFLVLAIGSTFLTPEHQINMMWLVALYIIHTCGELCLSPVGLSMVTKLAPAKFMSMLMGVWLASSFFGNLMGGYFATLSAELKSITTFFTIPAITLMVFGLLVWLFSGKIKSWMHGVN
ncbi:MAG: peptide MFS transporter [Elusimicrobiaceae bacterium]|nr:peptide MFS transporter [Elusimicrobiaceae bacterium]